MSKLPTFEAVVFDMDGTLTVPVLDFDAMRAEMGILDGLPVLEAIERMTPPQRALAERILHRHEAQAAQAAVLNPGAGELLDELTRRAIPFALFTRNSRVSVEAFCRKFAVRFAAVHTREDGPTKPLPDPVLRVCRQMAVEPTRSLVVGDFLFDILAGKAAGATTCLVHNGQPPGFIAQADFAVANLGELKQRLFG